MSKMSYFKIPFLKETKNRDHVKEIYCVENKINLIRIKYDENIEDKLKWLIKN